MAGTEGTLPVRGESDLRDGDVISCATRRAYAAYVAGECDNLRAVYTIVGSPEDGACEKSSWRALRCPIGALCIVVSRCDGAR